MSTRFNPVMTDYVSQLNAMDQQFQDAMFVLTPYGGTPTALGVAVPGTNPQFARGDHVHPSVGLTAAWGTNSTALATTAFIHTTLGSSLAKSIAGSANVTLDAIEVLYPIIELTGAITGPISVIVPASARRWTFKNSTTGPYAVTIKTAAGSGKTVAQGRQRDLYCDGTNVAADNDAASVVEALGYIPSQRTTYNGRSKTWKIASFPAAYSGPSDSEALDFTVYDSSYYDEYAATRVVINRTGVVSAFNYTYKHPSFKVDVIVHDNAGTIEVYLVTAEYCDYYEIELHYNRTGVSISKIDMGTNAYARPGTQVGTTVGAGTLWTTASLTNLNQLTNGPGYLTGTTGLAKTHGSATYTFNGNYGFTTIASGDGANTVGNWARSHNFMGGQGASLPRAAFGAFGSDISSLGYAFIGLGSDDNIYNSANTLRVYPAYAAWGTNRLWHAGDIIPIANGGTGFATAAAGLAALGGLPLAGGTVTGNLTVGGNLTVNGTTTTVNSTTVTIADPVFTLGGTSAPASDDNKDRGIEFRWHDGIAAKLGFFGFDDSTGRMTFVPDAVNTAEVFSGAVGTIEANLLGNATNITGVAAIANGGTGQITAAAALTALFGVGYTTTTGSAKVPVGTTAQRDAAPGQGYFRYNSTLNQAEMYNGTAWGSVGGGATGGPGNNVFHENDSTVTQSYTITTNKNAMSAGPVTVADGVTVTVPDGSTWTIV